MVASLCSFSNSLGKSVDSLDLCTTDTIRINAIIYYAPTIFASLGLNASTTSLLATGVLGVVDVIFTLPAIIWVDAWGRRIFLMVGALGMVISHVVVAGITGHFAGNFQQAGGQVAGWVGVVFIWVSRNHLI